MEKVTCNTQRTRKVTVLIIGKKIFRYKYKVGLRWSNSLT